MIEREMIIDYIKREKSFSGIKRESNISHIGGKITSIIGPRRSGKTFYLLYLLNSKYQKALYLNFELLFLKKLSANEFFEIMKLHEEIKGYTPKILLLDEIQEVKDWQTLLRTLLDYGYEIIVTGSSSKLLSKEIATQLRGRSISYLLLPFSFREFLKAKNFKSEKFLTFEEKGKTLRFLREYLDFGGFPEVVLSNNRFQKEKLLKTYFDEIFLKDFVERHEIKSIELGRLLFEFIFQNFSKEISIKNIQKYLEKRVPFSKKTIYSYLENVVDTLSVFFLDRFSISVYVRKSWPKKIYIADTGSSIPLSFSGDIGKKMENTVFLELLRKTNDRPLMEIFYWKDYRGREVDFVVKEGLKVKQLIQVTYASGRDEIEKREIKSLLKASESLRCKNLLCITWDFEGVETIERKKIKFVPLWRWLTNI
ncbi:MAG: ATP-binding protein [Candidatus Aenigmarchaeota archaeon]|nr:ATP-binding protein [Candidatus Aenigmarchaeota archaeon]